MSRVEKLLKRVQEEQRNNPGVSLRELSRKFNVPEGAILETMREEGVQKVRRDRQENVLEEIRTWGPHQLHIHNDWAQSETTCDPKDLELRAGTLLLEKPGSRVEIDYVRVESIYFVESATQASVQFYNRRGRCIFQLIVRADPASLNLFRAAQEALCGK